jgi:hypothetical protein
MSNILDITNPTAPSAVYTTATTLLSNIVPGQDSSLTQKLKLLATLAKSNLEYIPNTVNPGFSYQYAFGTVRNNTNVTMDNIGGLLFQRTTGLASTAIASQLGVPQVAQIGQSLIQSSENYNQGFIYTSVPFTNLNKLPGILYQDFRSRKGYSTRTATAIRLDGSAAIARSIGSGFGSDYTGAPKSYWRAGAYAAASAAPGGAYSVFNRDAAGPFGYGWGDHGNIYALRNDFTATSHVATRWVEEKWQPIKNPLAQATPFRGDRVQVIDYRKGVDLTKIYQWKTTVFGMAVDKLGITQDFIKFFFTGPNLSPGLNKTTAIGGNEKLADDAIVFRATIDSVSDSFSPSWTPVTMIGRADPNYHYTSYSRNVTIGFTVYATDRDEMKPIWRKLNALAGYTAPTYNENDISMEGPWIRFTLGDLFFQQAAVISSLTYTLHDTNTTWEINIEDDPEMMQAPKKISVSMTLNIVTNELPQKGGKFYTLAKTFEDDDQAKDGNDNWLSDMKKNPVRPPEVINNTNPDDSIFGQLNPGDTEVPEGFKSDTISLFTDSVS